MKLRNKKTGEIVDCAVYCNGTFYHSVNDVFEEWEDYEEPKEYWFVNDLNGEPMKCELRYCSARDFADWSEERKKIGNYFETKEEAEKAAEKLNAWKRLKDKGFRFDNWDLDADDEDVNVLLRSDKYKGNQVYVFEKDLDLLFGGEE